MATTSRHSVSRMALKAMGLFGGVQVVGVLCSIVRTKLVALWIGPVGVGLFAIFNNALEMLNTATNLGIRSSSVRDIAQARERGEQSHVARVIAVVRRWSLWLALGGALLTLLLAPVLSRITFGDESHLWGFVALSVAVLLMAITNGEAAVLQGTARLRRLAAATMWGTIGGLVVSIPLFYSLRERSVVPSIVAYAAAVALAAIILRSREYPAVKVDARTTARMGTNFVKLGIAMTIGSFVTILATYIFNAWLQHQGGTQQVGFYQAGFTLVNKYTGLILAALGMEYYPRLSAVASSKMRLRVYVSQEINVAMAVMAPVVAAFVLLREPIVWLLYSSEFNVIFSLISWGMVGTVFRSLSWSIAFVILARGDGRTYVVTESLSAATGLALNIVGYHYWGLTGLGISYALWYILYTLIVGVVYYHRYHLSLSRPCLAAVAWTTLVALVAVLAMEHSHPIVAAITLVIALAVTLWQLRRLW